MTMWADDRKLGNTFIQIACNASCTSFRKQSVGMQEFIWLGHGSLASLRYWTIGVHRSDTIAHRSTPLERILRMKQTWRWFGPQDQVSLEDMLQAGVEGVVTALHHIPTGDTWSVEEIKKRQNILARLADGSPSNLSWDVVESLPVSEAIKKQKGDWRDHIANYKTSLGNLAAAGIEVICYNFMPILDWTRTDLNWRLTNGATCMRFDYPTFAAFDIHILQRAGAAEDYDAQTVAKAADLHANMDDAQKKALTNNVVASSRKTDRPKTKTEAEQSQPRGKTQNQTTFVNSNGKSTFIYEGESR